MEGVPIRNARRGDIPSLLLLWNAMMKEIGAADPRFALHAHAREHQAALFQKWIQDEEHLVVVAEEGGRLVIGFAVASIADGNGWQIPNRLGRISDVYVAPPRRRQGVARRLAGRLLDLLYETDVDTVRLAVAVSNEGAHAFWKSMGWEDLELVLQKDVDSA
ncbi:MAG: GNAT family N-acetyltransferase [Planctomycetota bacterium]|nr:GNAT family N-acetyltransferase [Planctomycetota bacterium]